MSVKWDTSKIADQGATGLQSPKETKLNKNS